MRVLQVNSVCGVGSTGRIATDIHNMLTEHGHESCIAYGRGEAKNCDNAIRIGSDLDNYYHVALTRLCDKHGFGSKRATEEFIQRVEDYDPDIIHLHNIHGYYLNVEIFFDYIKRSQKPVIWTLHDCWSFTGHCPHFEMVGCDKWKTECYKCPMKKEYPSSIFMDRSRTNFRRKQKAFTGIKNITLVTPSEWLASRVNESFMNEYNLQVINNGIDFNIFKPTVSNFRQENALEGKFLILGVANIWEPRKGLRHFIELARFLNEDEVIVLVGLPVKHQKGLPNNVLRIPKTSDARELVAIYTAADVFFNPTMEDTFPTTNLEALACGTPVVTFDTGGSAESTDDGSGFVVEIGNLWGVQESIDEIRSDGKTFYVEHCVKRVKDHFDKRERIQEYIDLYKRVGGTS